ncbi:phage integrase family protein [Calothrix sp. NIES-4101]|nr:phage integrase family protein [Calothrix sp. NIES-4101]
MTDDDKWITVDKRTKKLAIRFRVSGYLKQFYIASGLKDTKRNREIVRLKRDAISVDIALDRFDDSLDSYQFKKRKPKLETKNQTENLSLLDIWDKFSEYQANQVEKTTILNRYNRIRNYICKLPFNSLTEAPKIRDYHLKNTTKRMAWLLINYYAQCCDWAVNSELIKSNPFTKLKFKEPKQPQKEYKAFTIEQRDLIIKTFELSRFKHYASLIKFLFWTGCRPGEAFALTWGDISEDCRKIEINKSCNLYKIKKSTKNNKKRIFPVSENSKLHKLLISIKPDNADNNQLVFTKTDGGAISSTTTQKIWRGQYGQYKYLGVVAGLASKGKIPYLNLYATRHTFATWAITEGISPDKVAMWIGDRTETVLKYYSHPEVVEADCPDF